MITYIFYPKCKLDMTKLVHEMYDIHPSIKKGTHSLFASLETYLEVLGTVDVRLDAMMFRSNPPARRFCKPVETTNDN